MSLVPADIQVTFTANYVGDHRVCYRQGNSGDYTCIIVTCAITGECVAEISTFVDNDTCDEVLYTGYVQAACQAESSETGRVAWSFTFTPVPTCKSYAVTCTRLPIASVAVTNGGSGYTSTPNVVFVGGEVAPADAVAVLGTGGLLNPVSITNGGSEYYLGGSGVFSNVHVTGGTGSGALAMVTITSGVVTAITITTPGTGYSGSLPSYGLNNGDIDGAHPPLVDCLFSAPTDADTVISVTLNSGGVYTEIPGATFIGGGGSGAAADVTMEECPIITTGGCTGDDIDIPAGAVTGLGEEIVICATSTPTVASAYDIAEVSNCVCTCSTTTIGSTGLSGQVKAFYNDCAGGPKSIILNPVGSPSSIVACVVPGSVVFQPLSGDAAGTVSYGGDCT